MQHLTRPGVGPLGREHADLSSHRLTPGFHEVASTATLQSLSSWHSLQHASCVIVDELPGTLRMSSFIQSSPAWNAQLPGGAGPGGAAVEAQMGDACCARSAGTCSGDGRGEAPPCCHHGAAGAAEHALSSSREHIARAIFAAAVRMATESLSALASRIPTC